MAKHVQGLDLDNRIPSLSGETMRDFKIYEKMVRAHVLSTWAKDAEEKKAKMMTIGPALNKNLLALGNSVSTMVEMLDVNELAKEDGAERLLTYLRETRFQEARLAQLPRVF